jgi:hypothetical protein
LPQRKTEKKYLNGGETKSAEYFFELHILVDDYQRCFVNGS